MYAMGGDEPCDKVIGAKEKSIQCEACLEWYHPKCQSPCAEVFNAMDAYKLLWVCKGCRGRLSDILDTAKRIEERIEKSEKRIIKAMTDSKRESATEIERKVEGQLKLIKDQVTKQQESTSETLKKMARNQERAAEMERGNNLVIHGLEESQKTDAAQRKEEDRQSIVDLGKVVCGNSPSLKISEVIRLGKRDENQASISGSATQRPRLLLVKFETKEDASRLFQERFGLRDAGFRHVYINRDMSKEERERQFKLREELKAKGRDTHRIFRGKVIPREE